MCVISDKSSILGLGGIIGGIKTSTEFETKNILLESAYFLPSSIRKTSRDLAINTDANIDLKEESILILYQKVCKLPLI